MEGFELWVKEHSALAGFLTSIVSAIVTLAAVLVAWRTAASTRQTVAEMREARLQAVRPVLYMTRLVPNIEIRWERDKQAFPSIYQRSVAESTNLSSLFEIRNTVESPAFDVETHWQADAKLSLPDNFRLSALHHYHAADKRSITYKKDLIEIKHPDDDMDFLDYSIEYSNNATLTHHEILGSKEKSCSIPFRIQQLIAVYVLYHAERYQLYRERFDSEDKTLDIVVNYSSPSGERIARKFRFNMDFWIPRFSDGEGKTIPQGSLPDTWKKFVVNGTISIAKLEEKALVSPQHRSIFAILGRLALNALAKFARFT
jgi:hypothetical protein